jgi:hypothetical protein
MKSEFIVLTFILFGALYLFWTQRLRTDIAALLVMLSLAIPWPRPDGKWSAILSPQEAFSGFGTLRGSNLSPRKWTGNLCGGDHGDGDVCV